MHSEPPEPLPARSGGGSPDNAGGRWGALARVACSPAPLLVVIALAGAGLGDSPWRPAEWLARLWPPLERSPGPLVVVVGLGAVVVHAAIAGLLAARVVAPRRLACWVRRQRIPRRGRTWTVTRRAGLAIVALTFCQAVQQLLVAWPGSDSHLLAWGADWVVALAAAAFAARVCAGRRGWPANALVLFVAASTLRLAGPLLQASDPDLIAALKGIERELGDLLSHVTRRFPSEHAGTAGLLTLVLAGVAGASVAASSRRVVRLCRRSGPAVDAAVLAGVLAVATTPTHPLGFMGSVENTVLGGRMWGATHLVCRPGGRAMWVYDTMSEDDQVRDAGTWSARGWRRFGIDHGAGIEGELVGPWVGLAARTVEWRYHTGAAVRNDPIDDGAWWTLAARVGPTWETVDAMRDRARIQQRDWERVANSRTFSENNAMARVGSGDEDWKDDTWIPWQEVAHIHVIRPVAESPFALVALQWEADLNFNGVSFWIGTNSPGFDRFAAAAPERLGINAEEWRRLLADPPFSARIRIRR